MASFQFFESYWDSLKHLTETDRAAVITAICEYAFENRDPDLQGVPAAIFAMFRPVIEKSIAKSKAGEKGGKTSTRARQTQSKAEANDKQTQSKAEANDNGKGKGKGKGKGTTKPIDEKTPGRFSPPSVIEVSEYVKSNGYSVDPSAFVNYYDSNGWRVGKNPMRDWRAAVRSWQSKRGASNETYRRTGEPDFYEPQKFTG